MIEAKNISKAYGDKLLVRKPFLHAAAGRHCRRDRPQRRGQVDLFKMITGQETPDSGTIEIGDTVHLGYVDQSRDDLTPTNNVWEEISDGLDYMQVNGHDTSTKAYVGAFNFKGADQQKNVGKLSGGERNRVHMAKMLKQGGNVCCSTSRPTTLMSRRWARSKTRSRTLPAAPWSSRTIASSWIDLATHILAFEGNSHVEWFEGNFRGL